MNEKFEDANKASENDLSQLKLRALKHKSIIIQNKAIAIDKASFEFLSYIEKLKQQMLSKANIAADNIDFSEMDKSSQLFFKHNRVVGNAFVLHINNYREEIEKQTKGYLNEELHLKLQKTFETNNRGVVDWLTYEFDGFPIIASYTKLTALQNDIDVVEVLSYKTILEAE